VNAGRLAGANAEQISGVFSKRLDIAEIEFLRARHGSDRPGFTAVDSSTISPLGAANPGDAGTHNAQAAELGFGGDGLCLPLGECDGSAEAENNGGEEKMFHGGWCPG